jgi:hypothetical protein
MHRPTKNPAAPTQHANSTVTRGLLPAILEPDWERLTVTRGSPEHDLTECIAFFACQRSAITSLVACPSWGPRQ